MTILGAHISIAGGIEFAPRRALEIKADSMQVFTANQRQWKSVEISDEQARLFREARRENAIEYCISHASYLINIASSDEKNFAKSLRALKEEFIRCQKLGIDGVVLHPGGHLGKGIKKGVEQICRGITELFALADNKVSLLLESTAGQGSGIGHSFQQLKAILTKMDHHSRLMFCLDTAHLFAAGYDLRTPEEYETTMQKLDDSIGIHRVKALHFNDSMKDIGSRVDRHAKIGEGFLGKQTFAHFINDPRWEKTPAILETPVSDYRNYAEELKILRELEKT